MTLMIISSFCPWGRKQRPHSSFLCELSNILAFFFINFFRDPFLSSFISENPQELKKSGEMEKPMLQFSAAFSNKVVNHVVNELQEEDKGEEYSSDLKAILTAYNGTTTVSTLNDESYSQPFAQLDAGVQLQEFNTAQKHLWQEITDNIKKDLDKHPYIALSMTAAATVASAAVSQQRGWREGEVASELQADVVLFTCNHHFPRVYFQEFVLPEFQQRMSELTLPLKHTTKLLLKIYCRVEGCLPTACPICVYNSIRMEQLEMVEQSASGESLQARPWDI